jgi:hypothetical protein
MPASGPELAVDVQDSWLPMSSMLTFEELHSAFVLLCGGSAAKRSEISPAPGARIGLA